MSGSEEVTLSDLLPATYSLAGLNVYNWGPFNKRHSADIDHGGTAIIGPTGSGKTTLVDAFMTLICPQPKYNLASTGGHESDRDLISYVRGVSGAGNGSGGTDHISRPSKTVTAIEACFDNGDNSVSIAAVLWVDSSSSAMADLKRAWIFSENGQYGLDEFLETQQESGMRGLKLLGREVSGVYVSDNKKSYLAHLRRFFDVGDNAFTLLNRAAGLKQINSIDDLFRELVLDDRSAFTRAAEVSAEFDDLAVIHAELETARQQQMSLQPISIEHEKLNGHLQMFDKLQELQKILPIWYAQHAYELWGQRENGIQERLNVSLVKCAGLIDEIITSENHTNSLRDIYMSSGGASIESIEQQIKMQNMQLSRCQIRANNYKEIAKVLNFDQTINAESLLRNQELAITLAKEQRPALENKTEAVFKCGAENRIQQDKVNDLENELKKVASSHSNIPGSYLEFQGELSRALGMDVGMLPFAAELVEVKAEESQWRGAIERALGGHRLRLLVPERSIRQALAWVNNRHNKLNVRLLRVEDCYSHAKFLEDGFTKKFNFKSHPYREALKNMLASIDRHCVEDADELQNIPRGMTAQGLMSGKKGYFDKQDRRRLDQDWMTGFDNRDRVARISRELKIAQGGLTISGQQLEIEKQSCSQLEKSLALIEKIVSQDFIDIDVPGVEKSINKLQFRLDTIRDPESDTACAEKNWKSAQQELKSLREIEKSCLEEKTALELSHKEARAHKDSAFKTIGEGLTGEEIRVGDDSFVSPEVEKIEEQEKKASQQLQKELDSCVEQISVCKVNLAKLMTKAKKIDTGALAESGTELEDLPQYIEQLRILIEEALPEKQARFLAYLNQSSDQGVTQLLMNIKSEVDKIKDRIDDLNSTMRRVDYQPGRYLRLEPKPVVHESLRTLTKAQQHLRYIAAQDDNGSNHYRALQTVVDLLRDASERKRTKAAQALLDPRYRLQFSVSVIDRSSGLAIETRTGSQGGSGGEKEIIASYILTASLSYALCPDGSASPLFGTVVLDEAFSRSSQAVAGRIIAALREFGLHPLFITPNKEIKLLRSHTRSAVLIHNAGARATMTSLSWEELEQHATKQRNRQHEITE
ncbi:hypothetical protein A9Q81_08290 [Gammaproteobacteria bacterium 42_54_T18]|nr:hypothetical protein A9Q81_08290 [Gammaproteobacteria bacterium 42_54_T18]